MPSGDRLRESARLCIRASKPSILLLALVYFIIYYTIDALLYFFGGFRPSFPWLFVILAANRFGADIPVNYVPITFVKSTILFAVCSAPLEAVFAGYAYACLNLSRGREAGWDNLLYGFTRFFKVIWLNILMAVFIRLWSLLFVITGIVATYRYSMAFYIMQDNPEYSAVECIRRSREMMDGHKLDLFRLHLSMFGWLLLELLIPFAEVYVSPYMSIVDTGFYNHLSGHNRKKALKPEKSRV